MICPNCSAEMSETVEERWSGRYNNVLSVIIFYDCQQCGFQTDSTEQPEAAASTPEDGQAGSATNERL